MRDERKSKKNKFVSQIGRKCRCLWARVVGLGCGCGCGCDAEPNSQEAVTSTAIVLRRERHRRGRSSRTYDRRKITGIVVEAAHGRSNNGRGGLRCDASNVWLCACVQFAE